MNKQLAAFIAGCTLVIGGAGAGAYLAGSGTAPSLAAPAFTESAAPVASSDSQVDWVSIRRAAGEAAGQASLLRAGTSQLASGVTGIKDRLPELTDGVNRLNEGAKQLEDGLVQLQAGTGQLGTGATQIADGVQLITERLQGLVALQMQALGILDKVDNSLAKSTDANAPKLREQLAQVREQLTNIGINAAVGDQLDQLRSGSRDLANQIAVPGYAYHDGIYQATKGAHELAAGMDQLSGAVGEATSGLDQLADGVARIDTMVGKTTDGLGTLNRSLPALADDQAPQSFLSPAVALLIMLLASVLGTALGGRDLSRRQLALRLAAALPVALGAVALAWLLGTDVPPAALGLISGAAVATMWLHQSLSSLWQSRLGLIPGRTIDAALILAELSATALLLNKAAAGAASGLFQALAGATPLNWAATATALVGNGSADNPASNQASAITCALLIAAAILGTCAALSRNRTSEPQA